MVAKPFDPISVRNLDFITSRDGMINANMIKDGRNVHFGLLLAKSRKRAKWDGKNVIGEMFQPLYSNALTQIAQTSIANIRIIISDHQPLPIRANTVCASI